MPQLLPYLTFNGNCHDAMVFYQACLGGELLVATMGDSGAVIPEQYKSLVVKAVLIRRRLLLIGTDLANARRKPGNAAALHLQCDSEEQAASVFEKLCAQGAIVQPLSRAASGTLCGEVEDHYGYHWHIEFDHENTHHGTGNDSLL